MNYTISPFPDKKVTYEVQLYSPTLKKWIMDTGNYQSAQKAYKNMDDIESRNSRNYEFRVIQRTESIALVEREV